MESIIFESDWQDVFAAAGLRTVEDFLTTDRGQQLGRNRRRSVVTFVLETPAGPRRFYMKRFIRPHVKDMLATLRRFGRPCSQAECEWRHARTLLGHGIETYHPVCYGVRTQCGLERASFIVTEEIRGRCLTDWLAEAWADLADDGRRALLVSIGQLARRLHDVDIGFPDLYAWHIYLLEPVGPSSRLALIDLHRMRCGVRRLGSKLRDLGALEYSLIDRYFDDEAYRTLFNAYRRPRDVLPWERFRARIGQRANTLRRRRRHPPDY